MPLRSKKVTGGVLLHWEEEETGLLVPHCSAAVREEVACPKGMLDDVPGLAGPETRAPSLGKEQQNYSIQRGPRKRDSGLLRGDRNGLLKSLRHL